MRDRNYNPTPEPTGPTGSEVNSLINHVHYVAEALDNEVHDRALDTGLTERLDFLTDLTPRQNLVRLMVRVTHELNSLLDVVGDQPILGQPTQYGPSNTTWGA